MARLPGHHVWVAPFWEICPETQSLRDRLDRRSEQNGPTYCTGREEFGQLHQHSERLSTFADWLHSCRRNGGGEMSHDVEMAAPSGGAIARFLRSPMNWLLIFIPVTIALEHVEGVSAPVIFFSAALSIVPIAAMIVSATEQLAVRT